MKLTNDLADYLLTLPKKILDKGTLVNEIVINQTFPFYTTEVVVRSYLGYNTNFPSQDEWLEESDYFFNLINLLGK